VAESVDDLSEFFIQYPDQGVPTDSPFGSIATGQYKPSGTICNDLNDSYVSHAGSYSGWYYSGGKRD